MRSVAGEWNMSKEHWWKDADIAELKSSEKTLSQRNSAYYKSHTSVFQSNFVSPRRGTVRAMARPIRIIDKKRQD
jgi:hypothetical protein